MTEDILYLRLGDVLRLHARMFAISPLAASDRLTNARALESALARDNHYVIYENADVAMQAEILAHGIA